MVKGILEPAGEESAKKITLRHYFFLHYLSSFQHVTQAICTGNSFLKAFDLEELQIFVYLLKKTSFELRKMHYYP